MDTPGNAQDGAALSLMELDQLNRQIRDARAVLGALRSEVAELESLRDADLSLAMRDVNEQLLLTSLLALNDVDQAGIKLRQLAQAAQLDNLTGLPNRRLLLDRLTQAIANVRRHGGRFALMFVDLNNFKSINDAYGHAAGDQVLRLAATSLVAAVREVDTVSRHGGDEFLVLACDISSPADALRVAEALITALVTVKPDSAPDFHLKASIGISLYPDHGPDAASLIERADTAMYRAKRRGLGMVMASHPSDLDALSADSSSPSIESRADRDERQRERQESDLREVNEQLILAALRAQQLYTEARAVNGEQRRFLAVVAHELRNPLTPIRTAGYLLDRVRAEELPRMQRIIERQVRHMLRLVSDLLDIARTNTGKLSVKLCRLDLGEAIDESIEASVPAMQIREQRFVQRGVASGLFVLGDLTRLIQVFSNLLDNASKYTPEAGSIELAVEASEQTVTITVSDSGMGITPQAMPTIFEPFVQSALARVFSGAGLGIGLTVVRELVTAHGGAVTASSPGRDRGSVFTVTLPRWQRTDKLAGDDGH